MGACAQCGGPAQARSCLRCGYSLAGLGDEGECPECNEAYAREHLVLAGVPKASSSGYRRLAWVVLLVAGWMVFQGWAFFPGWLVLILGVGVLLGIPVLLFTSRRERAGVERFVVSPGGICRVPFRVKKAKATSGEEPATHEADRLFVAWGGSNMVRLTRVGPVWRRLQVGRVSAEGVFKDVVFDAGVRCPDDAAEGVRAAIQGLIDAHRARSAHEEGPRGGPFGGDGVG